MAVTRAPPVADFMRKTGAEVVKPTKTKLSSFAPKNPTNKATRSKGRTSAMKDNIANDYAGGREFKALMLNVADELFTGEKLSADRYVEMLVAILAPRRPTSWLTPKEVRDTWVYFTA